MTCPDCEELAAKLAAAEQAIELMAPSAPGEIVALRCQMLEIRRMLATLTNGRYAILADGLAAGRLYGAYYTIKDGQPLRGEPLAAVVALLEAVGVIDLR